MTDDARESPLDRLEVAAENIVGRAAYEQANRRGLLWVHAVVTTVAGTQMLFYGTANTIEVIVGPWVRELMFSIGVSGGLMLMLGLLWRPRSIPLEIGGLTLIAVWDLILAFGLLYARLHQHSFHPLALAQPQPPGYIVAYAPTIYAGYFALVSIHVLTLAKMVRARRGPL